VKSILCGNHFPPLIFASVHTCWANLSTVRGDELVFNRMCLYVRFVRLRFIVDNCERESNRDTLRILLPLLLVEFPFRIGLDLVQQALVRIDCPH